MTRIEPDPWPYPRREGYWSNGVESEKSAMFPDLAEPEKAAPRRKLHRRLICLTVGFVAARALIIFMEWV